MYLPSLIILAAGAIASPLVARQNSTVAGNNTTPSVAPSSLTATSTPPSLNSAGASLNSSGTSVSPSQSTSGSSSAKGGLGGLFPGQPVVTVKPSSAGGRSITIKGKVDVTPNVDAYLGIPYAAAPVGDLRFKPPQDYTWSKGSELNAVTQPPACLQANTQYGLYGENEDCLFLNVQTPHGSNANTPAVPVMVWVHGGGFINGAASAFNGIAIQQQSQDAKRPVVYVALNYRLGIFGFPQGDEAFGGANGNPGLRDVRKGLEWVKENIRAFGGDPEKITVFGESGGAILISLLYLQPNLNLFRSAIMQSGTPSTSPIGPTGSSYLEAYKLLLNNVGCSKTSPGFNSVSEYECLRKLDAGRLLGGQLAVRADPRFAQNFFTAPSIDGDVIPDSPHKLLASGQFAKIPFITGNVRDEGTPFIALLPQGPYDTQERAEAIFANFYSQPPSNQTIHELLTTYYPNIPSQGAPYGTGDQTFGLPSQFKQLAAAFGDGYFESRRRYILDQAAANGLTETWSYLFEVIPPGTAPPLGCAHSADLSYTFGVPQAAAIGINIPILLPAPVFQAGDVQASRQMIDYWVNFAYYTDPSPASAAGSRVAWPKYGSDRKMVTFTRTASGPAVNNIISDTYRQAGMDYFQTKPEEFGY